MIGAACWKVVEQLNRTDLDYTVPIVGLKTCRFSVQNNFTHFLAFFLCLSKQIQLMWWPFQNLWCQ